MDYENQEFIPAKSRKYLHEVTREDIFGDAELAYSDSKGEKKHFKITCKLHLEKFHAHYAYTTLFVIFPKDGVKRMVSCSYDNYLKVYNLKTGKIEQNVKTSHPLHHIVFRKNVILGCDNRGHVHIYQFDIRNKNRLKNVKVIRIGTEVTFWRMFWFEKNKFMATGTNGEIVICKNFMTSKPVSKVVYKHPRDVWSNVHRLKTKAYQRFVVLGCYAPNILVRLDLKEEIEPFQFPVRHTYSVCFVESFFNKKGKETIISGAWDEKICVWKLDGTFLKELKMKPFVQSGLLVFNHFMLLGAKNGHIYSLNLRTFELKDEIGTQGHKLFYMIWMGKQKGRDKFHFCCSSQDNSVAFYEIGGLKLKKKDRDVVERISFLIENDYCDFRIQLKYSKIMIVKSLF